MEDDDFPHMPRPSRKPRPPRLTPAAMERAALHYLSRYDCTTAQLRLVLERRVQRARRLGVPEDVLAGADGIIDALLCRFAEKNYLNDRRFAEARRDGAARAGRSGRDLAHRLRLKGVADDDIAAILADRPVNADLAAAYILARKRRLGPWRGDTDTRRQFYQKDLATLARAGFSPDIAQKILRADSPESIEAELTPVA